MRQKIFTSYSHVQADWIFGRLEPCLRYGGAETLVDRACFQAGKALLRAQPPQLSALNHTRRFWDRNIVQSLNQPRNLVRLSATLGACRRQRSSLGGSERNSRDLLHTRPGCGRGVWEDPDPDSAASPGPKRKHPEWRR